MIESLGPYAIKTKLTMEPTMGKFTDHHFFSERCHHEDDFVEQQVSDEFIKVCNTTGKMIYLLTIEVLMKHGKPSWDTSWRFEPKFKTFVIGFAGVSMDGVIAEAVEWCKEHTDSSIEAFDYKYGSYLHKMQPLAFNTKRYPHYLEPEK